jgi:UDP-glucose 4-epimerase
MAFNETIGLSEGTFDQNVMGTMKLVGACAESGVRRIVLKSSTMVYGANADNDAFLTEESDLRGGRRYGYNRYRLEIESFLNGFRRQAPQLGMTVLRFANIVGPTADSPLTRYLEHRVTPVLFGFDPMMQVIHENDAIEAIAQSIQTEVEGIFNVAADPPLPLLRILAIAGRVPCPVLHPFAYRGRTWFGSRRLRLRAAFEPDYLRFRWVADIEKMKDELGFLPVHSADEAVASLSAKMRTSQYGRSVDSAYDEAKLEQEIEQRRRHAFASAKSGPEAGAFNED